MLNKLSRSTSLFTLVLAAFLLTQPMAAFANEGYSLLDSQSGGDSGGGAHADREYYSSNKDNRFLIKVHLWGDIPLSGIHNVPDNTTLLDLIGYAGGPTGYLAESTITVTRVAKEKDSYPQSVKVEGKELVSNNTYRNMPLKAGDVIYMEAPPKSDTLIRNLTIIGAVLGIITASAAVYLVAKK